MPRYSKTQAGKLRGSVATIEQRAAERIKFRETGASLWLDATRGCAALLVLLDHCHNLFFVGRETAMQATGHRLWTALFYSLRTAGTAAVVVFFVLSGYLISGSVLRAVEQGRWSWKDYLTHRFVRLWLVLLPALVLCAEWDAWRVALEHALGQGSAGGFAARLATAGVTTKLFVANALFLGSIHADTFGSDRVLWSLAAEFWYYLLFPLGLLALRRQTSVSIRVMYALIFLLVAAFTGRGVLGLFPVWLLGAGLAMVPAARCGAALRWLAVVLFVPVLLVLGEADWPWRYFKMAYVLGLATALFLWVMLSDRRRVNESAVGVRATRRLAQLSYSLYLVHYPLLAFGATWLVRRGKWLPSSRTLLEGAGICAMALAYSYGVASLTEFHTDAVRRWVQERLWERGRPRVT